MINHLVTAEINLWMPTVKISPQLHDDNKINVCFIRSKKKEEKKSHKQAKAGVQTRDGALKELAQENLG